MLSSERIKELVLNSRLGIQLTESEMMSLIEHSQVISFKAGDVLLKQGYRSLGMYLILEGTSIVTAKMLGEGIMHLETLITGDFAGEISLIENAPCAASVTAKTDMTCLLISKDYFDVMGVVTPKIKFKIIDVMLWQVCQRLKKVYSKISSFMQSTAMTTRSLFAELVQSFTKPTGIDVQEMDLRKLSAQLAAILEIRDLKQSENLINDSELIQAPKHCTLIADDEKNPLCYIILQGAVQASIAQNNKLAKLGVLGPSDLFCNLSVVDPHTPSLINYVTREKTILLRISEKSLVAIKENFPELWSPLYFCIAKSMVGAERAADRLDIRLNSELYNRDHHV